MRYKKFADTGHNLSVLSLGTWALGGKEYGDNEERDSIAAIHAMIDHGVNVVDTALTYAQGDSEAILGRALQGKRDKVFLITKVGIYWPPGHKDFKKGATRDSSRKRIFMQIDECLGRLQTDYVDGLLIHWPDVNTPIEETVDALNDLKKIGKIRYAGMSNFESPLVDRMWELGGVQIAQYPYSMVNTAQEAYHKKFTERGSLTMAWGTLGSGVLTGAIREKPVFPETDARAGFYKALYAEPQFSKTMELLKTLDSIAENRGVPIPQIVVNWTIQNDFISMCLTGVRNVKEADENCAAMDWELDAEELKMINDAIDTTVGRG